MNFARIGYSCWVILLLTASAFCQSDRGSIRGTIADTSDAVIPNAKVTALNTATGIGSSTVTTGANLYELSTLPAATYRIQVEHTGFKTLIRECVPIWLPCGIRSGRR